MEPGMKKKELLELKTDIKLLLECLDYQKDDACALKQALVTISSILQGSGEAKNLFRDIGGLQQVLTIVTSHRKEEVVETGLYCLGSAVDKNVFSQKLLTTASVFTFLHGILSSTSRSSVRRKQTASFLVLCLVSNNGFGQHLVRQSSCLHDILSLIRTTLPKNMKELDSDWFEGIDGRSLDLWSTLLSTACACVNNPLNEENQRICCSLLPYLFSLLTSQTDDRIIRPILSLIGLTVSGNESNQGRVRKCGGLDIFVKKLEWLQSKAVCENAAKITAVQILSTIDTCLSDNDCNSKKFGDLGGIKLVLSMFSDCCLDLGDKTQAVLTLAHAVDAHNDNQKHIMEGGGMAVLIQQLTETQDEELSKTVKYLLHMCVSTGNASVADADNDLNDTEQLVSKMEAMKRHNEVEVLKRINELDSKLKSLGDKHQQIDHNQLEIPTQYSPVFERSECHRSNVQPTGNVDQASSLTGSHGEHSTSYHQDCPTSREQSLMQQLIQEKIEKERLEKLNHMLQENICKSHTALTSTHIENVDQRQNPQTDLTNTANIDNQTQRQNPQTALTNAHIVNVNQRQNPQTALTNAHIVNVNQRQNPQTALTNAHIVNVNHRQNHQTHGPTFYPEMSANINTRLETGSNEQNRNVTITSDMLNLLSRSAGGNMSVLEHDCGVLDYRNAIGSGNTYSTTLRTDQVVPLNLNIKSRDKQIQSPDAHSLSRDTLSMVTRSGQRYQMLKMPGTESNNNFHSEIDNNYQSAAYYNPQVQNCPPFEHHRNATQCLEKGYALTNQVKDGPSVSRFENAHYLNNSQSKYVEMNELPYSAAPLDLSHQAGYSVPDVTKPLVQQNQRNKQALACDGGKQESIGLAKKQVGEHADCIKLKSKTVINRNAEIQCGTPYVFRSDKQSENDKTVCINDSSSQTDFLKTPQSPIYIAGQRSENTKSKGILIEKNANIDCQSNEKRKVEAVDSNLEEMPVVTISKSTHKTTLQKKLTESEHKKSVNAAKSLYTSSPISSVCMKSSGFFVKPVALPPKSRVRITPYLGSNKLIGTSFGSSRNSEVHDKNNNSTAEEFDSDVQSEFDLHLAKAVKRQMPNIKSSLVVKSQNNVRQIDKCVGSRERNVAEKWQVQISTPQRQSIIPARPAFSDCGTRRLVLGSYYSVKSHARRRSLDDSGLDDSGIHSPRDILNISSERSPVDSNIDGFRSSSDVSDDDEGIPNISAAVLRSSKKVTNCPPNSKCPGCNGFYSPSEGLELNSRTYNIALETDPNTCPMHRNLRQIERIYIQKLRKSKRLQSKRKGELICRLPLLKSRQKKDSVYDFPSDSAGEISPLSEDNVDDVHPPQRLKKRRIRVPYTTEEERHLEEGVRTLGKHWNQILVTYSFHPSRTNVDLKDKYKRMTTANSRDGSSMKTVSVAARSHRPFSMCEDRRLRRGIMKYGYNWQTILRTFTFTQGRTTEDLRNKWRTLHKKK